MVAAGAPTGETAAAGPLAGKVVVAGASTWETAATRASAGEMVAIGGHDIERWWQLVVTTSA